MSVSEKFETGGWRRASRKLGPPSRLLSCSIGRILMKQCRPALVSTSTHRLASRSLSEIAQDSVGCEAISGSCRTPGAAGNCKRLLFDHFDTNLRSVGGSGLLAGEPGCCLQVELGLYKLAVRPRYDQVGWDLRQGLHSAAGLQVMPAQHILRGLAALIPGV